MTPIELFALFATLFLMLSGLLVTWIAEEYGLRQKILSFIILAGVLWAIMVSILVNIL
jgi:hypothetical protein